MLLFGGRYRAASSGAYDLYNDLWAFDFASQTWTEIDDGAGTAPQGRYFPAAAYDPDSSTFYAFGGGTGPNGFPANPVMDLWAFDADGWRQVTTTNAPGTRMFVAYTYDSERNRLVIFAGQIGDFLSPAENELYAIDLGTGAWTELHDGTGLAPSGRFSSMMTYDAAGDRYIVMGGHADIGVTNDVWAFNPTANTWSLIRDADSFTGAALGCLGNNQEIPADYVDQDTSAPERRSGGVFAVIGDDAVLFAGEGDCSDHLDDTWRFNLSQAEWTEVISSRSGESCARRNDDCPCLCL